MRASQLAATAALLSFIFLALALAGEPRRVRVTLADGSIVEGTIEGSKDGVYKVKVGSTEVSLAERDVKKVEFLEAAAEKKKVTAATGSDPLPFNPFALAKEGDEAVYGVRKGDVLQNGFRYAVGSVKVGRTTFTVDQRDGAREQGEIKTTKAPSLIEFLDHGVGMKIDVGDVSVEEGGPPIVFCSRSYAATRLRFEGRWSYDEKPLRGTITLSPELPYPCIARIEVTNDSADGKTGFVQFELLGCKRAGAELVGESWADLKARIAPAKEAELEKKPEPEKKGMRPLAAPHAAVAAGLDWLSRHQSEDGHWSATGYMARCKGGPCTGTGLDDFDVGLTGLAVLAFLGAGYGPGDAAEGAVVKKGLDYLVAQQQDGAFGPRVGEAMYNHAIATLALVEATRLTGSGTYVPAAQRGLDYIKSSQNPGLAWRYTPQPGNNDTSITGWCVGALSAGEAAGLKVDRSCYEGVRTWLRRVTDEKGQTGYDRLGTGEIYVPGKNEQWQHHQTMTAVGVRIRLLVDAKRDPGLARSVAIFMRDLPRWDPKAAKPTNDSYYWYQGTLALSLYDGPDGDDFGKWSAAVLDALLPNQCKDGCAGGSWDASGVERWAYAGGRVYTTAINLLTLEKCLGAPVAAQIRAIVHASVYARNYKSYYDTASTRPGYGNPGVDGIPQPTPPPVNAPQPVVPEVGKLHAPPPPASLIPWLPHRSYWSEVDSPPYFAGWKLDETAARADAASYAQALEDYYVDAFVQQHPSGLPVLLPPTNPLPWNPFAKAQEGDETVYWAVDTSHPEKPLPARFTVYAGTDKDKFTVVKERAPFLEAQDRHSFSRTEAPPIDELAEFFLGITRAGTVKLVGDVEVTFAGKTYSAKRYRISGRSRDVPVSCLVTFSPDLPAPGIAEVQFTSDDPAGAPQPDLRLRGFKHAGEEPVGDKWSDLEEKYIEGREKAEPKKDR
jgi:hypothetical protein